MDIHNAIIDQNESKYEDLKSAEQVFSLRDIFIWSW